MLAFLFAAVSGHNRCSKPECAFAWQVLHPQPCCGSAERVSPLSFSAHYIAAPTLLVLLSSSSKQERKRGSGAPYRLQPLLSCSQEKCPSPCANTLRLQLTLDQGLAPLPPWREGKAEEKHALLTVAVCAEQNAKYLLIAGLDSAVGKPGRGGAEEKRGCMGCGGSFPQNHRTAGLDQAMAMCGRGRAEEDSGGAFCSGNFCQAEREAA